jgi:hypothetical protein
MAVSRVQRLGPSCRSISSAHVAIVPLCVRAASRIFAAMQSNVFFSET